MKIHIVRPGEQIWDIVQRYNIPIERLLEANPNIMEPEQLETGSKIRIPTGRIPVSPLKRERSDQFNDLEQTMNEKEEMTEFQLQPVVSRPEMTETRKNQVLKMVYVEPIPMEEFQLHNEKWESHIPESSGIAVEDVRWLESSSSFEYFSPTYTSPFLPFYPTEAGFYPHPYAATISASTPPSCDDCGQGPTPMAFPYPFPSTPYMMPYGLDQFFQSYIYEQPSQEVVQNEETYDQTYDEAYESSSAEY